MGSTEFKDASEVETLEEEKIVYEKRVPKKGDVYIGTNGNAKATSINWTEQTKRTIIGNINIFKEIYDKHQENNNE